MKNSKGFTLIELLAVITIMGILMLVAIPTISRTIENARKDTFIDMAQQYANAVKNMWAADSFQCDNGYSSSAVPAGCYYVEVDTSGATSQVPVLLEQGGKSPWGKRDVKGIILIAVWLKDNTRKITYAPILVDGIHGVNVNPDKGGFAGLKNVNRLKRGDVVMANANYSIVAPEGEIRNDWTFRMDINTDGDQDDKIDGVVEGGGQTTVRCIER